MFNIVFDRMDSKKWFWLLFSCLGAIWIYRKFKNYFRAVLLALRLPGPKAVPFFGNVLLFLEKKTNVLIGTGNNALQLYGPLMRGWMFWIPVLIVYEPDHLKVILSNTKISDKSFFYRIMHTFIGDGLVTSTGEKWKKHRKIIQPYFHINVLESYFDDFLQISEKVLCTELNGKKLVKISSIVNSCINKILHKTILGVDLQTDFESPFRRGELLLLKRLLKPWLLLDFVFKRSKLSQMETQQNEDLHLYVKKILDERRILSNYTKIKNPCLLDRFVELLETNDFTEKEVLDEAVTFMLAGQDSVGTAVASCLFYLAKYQDIQEKVFREIADNNAIDDRITINQLNQMCYLEQCIKETMRLIPSIPLVARVLTADVNLGNYTVPKGTNILVSIYTAHRLPHIFPDPHKFNPDRFSSDNLAKIHPYGFLPYSLGPRMCIGYKFAYIEMKTILATVVKHFHLSLRSQSEEIDLSYRVTFRAKGGILLNVRSRQK